MVSTKHHIANLDTESSKQVAHCSNKVLNKFVCINCDYTTSRKNNFDKHISSIKHQQMMNPEFIKNACKPGANESCKTCKCGKQYVNKSGLWKHVKICKKIVNDTIIKEEFESSDIKNLTNLVLEMVKNNSEQQKQHNELQQQLLDVCKNNNNMNISHNNINSHNKTFNLQFFLNEQCKDAMNLSDFMNSFELQLEDLESIGELGYVEGITKIMVDRLNAMDIYKRPVHCSDAKRETLYVKNEDRWEKEARHNPKLRYAIKTASFKSMKLTVLWSDTYPESKSSESRLNDKYMKLVFNSTGGHGEIADSEDKIIRRILKEIVIEKS
jgi:hypothetical protein